MNEPERNNQNGGATNRTFEIDWTAYADFPLDVELTNKKTPLSNSAIMDDGIDWDNIVPDSIEELCGDSPPKFAETVATTTTNGGGRGDEKLKQSKKTHEPIDFFGN
jgi:hypothetical protein